MPGMRTGLLGFLFFWTILLEIHAEFDIQPVRGFFDKPFHATITTATPGKIRYTLDGSTPDHAAGKPYTGRIRIDRTSVLRVAVIGSDDRPVESTTHTYLFVSQVRHQEAEPAGYVNEIESWRLRYDQVFDWAMDPEIVNDTARNGRLEDHLLALPTLSIALAREDFNFLYRNHAERGLPYEKPASVELLYPRRDAYRSFSGFQINCGIRMQGGGAVIKARKKSFRLLFKKEYGAGKLDYPLFESAPHHAATAVDVFDNVILRAGGNANWSKDEAWKHAPTTYLRDTLVRDSQIAVAGYGARSTFVHLYINGRYFGLYNIAERPDDKFQASYWGGQPEDYHSFNHGGSVSGDDSAWSDLLSRARRRPEEANLFQEIDVPAFCDYLINQWYFGSGDWPWNNYYGGLRLEPRREPVRFFTWDAEFSLWTHTGYLESNDRGWANPLFIRGYSRRRSPLITLWNAVAEDPGFRLTFADRVYKHCYGNGALTEAKTKARFTKLQQALEGAIVAESARWGDAAYGQEEDPRTRHGNWLPECESILTLIEGNVEHFVKDLRRESLYPHTDPPLLPRPEKPVPVGTRVPLTLADGTDGTVYFTLDESDPRSSATDAPAATAWHYTGEPITLERPTILKARTRSPQGEWSALAEQLYLTTELGFPVRIHELMANPKGEQSLEFVELKNLSPVSIPLGNCRFDGIGYRFPPRTVLPGKGILVLIPNDHPEAFAKRYPRVPVFGHYRQHLSNKGETIRLLDPSGATLTAVTYGEPWPRGTGGDGRSLQPRNPRVAPSGSRHWKASAAAGGSPGR